MKQLEKPYSQPECNNVDALSVTGVCACVHAYMRDVYSANKIKVFVVSSTLPDMLRHVYASGLTVTL